MGPAGRQGRAGLRPIPLGGRAAAGRTRGTGIAGAGRRNLLHLGPHLRHACARPARSAPTARVCRSQANTGKPWRLVLSARTAGHGCGGDDMQLPHETTWPGARGPAAGQLLAWGVLFTPPRAPLTGHRVMLASQPCVPTRAAGGWTLRGLRARQTAGSGSSHFLRSMRRGAGDLVGSRVARPGPPASGWPAGERPDASQAARPTCARPGHERLIIPLIILPERLRLSPDPHATSSPRRSHHFRRPTVQGSASRSGTRNSTLANLTTAFWRP